MKTLIVANWKMNPNSLAEAKRLFSLIEKGIKNIKNVEVVICPPFIYLSSIKHQVSSIKLGGQDCFWKEEGAFTGEVSAKMLKDLGCEYVIIGHSERRRYLNETNEMISKKLRAAISFKLKPIFCVGETRQNKREEEGLKVLNSQISRGLKNIRKKEAKNVIIAYEPVWAIGTGKSCDPNTVLTKNLLIKGVIKKRYSPAISRKVRILYGGSVNSQNAKDFINIAKIDGLLVGGASLDPKEFVKIVKAVSGA